MSDVLIAILVLVALVALWTGPLWRGRPLAGVTRPRPWRLGHRGVVGPVPENSMAAFRMAFDAGLDGVETDVQRTRDGVLVLVHDDVTHGLRVAEADVAQLERAGAALARLDELFDLAERYPGTLLNLELKTARRRDGRLSRDVARAVRSRGFAGRVVVSSFNPVALAWLRLAAPSLRTALLWHGGASTPPILRTGWLARWLHVDGLHPHRADVDAATVARARAHGLMLTVWTVNDVEEGRRLRALGVGGIVGDDPNVLLAAIPGGPS